LRGVMSEGLGEPSRCGRVLRQSTYSEPEIKGFRAGPRLTGPVPRPGRPWPCLRGIGALLPGTRSPAGLVVRPTSPGKLGEPLASPATRLPRLGLGLRAILPAEVARPRAALVQRFGQGQEGRVPLGQAVLTQAGVAGVVAVAVEKLVWMPAARGLPWM